MFKLFLCSRKKAKSECNSRQKRMNYSLDTAICIRFSLFYAWVIIHEEVFFQQESGIFRRTADKIRRKWNIFSESWEIIAINHVSMPKIHSCFHCRQTVLYAKEQSIFSIVSFSLKSICLIRIHIYKKKSSMTQHQPNFPCDCSRKQSRV